MAHHQQTNHDRFHAAQDSSAVSGLAHSGVKHTAEEDEAPYECDEPPDSIRFAKRVTPGSQGSQFDNGYISSPHYKPASLLTQALLTSPELTPLSDTEAPVLTSDGGLTSPARTSTPSPPLPPLSHVQLAILGSKGSSALSHEQPTNTAQMPQVLGIDHSQETKVEESLGRRRCISFACGRQAPPQNKVDSSQTNSDNAKENIGPPGIPPKRPCMLRFACPTKPSRPEPREDQTMESVLHLRKESQSLKGLKEDAQMPPLAVREHQISDAPIMTSQKERDPSIAAVSQSRRTPVFNRVDFQKSEATRFHEFAGSFTEDDEWTKEQTAYRQKITISDTLRKENAFRKLGEEAEEEDALEEDADTYGNEDELEDDEGDENDGSDGGNETDDESVFGESDDESDGDPRYHFWTPGLTTAATSTDHLEDHLLPKQRRTASESSVESVVDLGNQKLGSARSCSKKKSSQNASSSRRTPSMRPGTPELPDSGNFVIGTIDEDRPLEDAYLSCLEQRKRSKHRLIPQDIDPSFPTSDFEAEDDQDDEDDHEEDDEDEECPAQANNHRDLITSCPDSSDEDHLGNRRKTFVGAPRKSSVPSPRRLHSPPPRRLFGQATHRLRSPPPMHRKLISPPSSRRPSLSGSPSVKSRGIHISHLAQRPNLTHTTSLPRTPNPFWGLHRNSRLHGFETPSTGTSPKTMAQTRSDPHSRGPIDIVQGLETKRQRRKEKFWRQHCRNAQTGKEKERRHQPGKGVERMRELGLEMAVRFKGYNQKANIVLSV